MEISQVSVIYLITPVGDTLVVTDEGGNQTYIYLNDQDVHYLRDRIGTSLRES